VEEVDLERARDVIGAVAERPVGPCSDRVLPHADLVSELVDVDPADRMERPLNHGALPAGPVAAAGAAPARSRVKVAIPRRRDRCLETNAVLGLIRLLSRLMSHMAVP